MSDPVLHRFPHHAMATVFEVIIAGQDPNYARQAAQAVFAEIDRLEGLLTRFRPSSDVSVIKGLSPGQSARVSFELFECLTIALEVFRKTRGAFDPTIGAIMSCLRTPGGAPLQMTYEVRDKVLQRVGMEYLRLDNEDLTVGISADAPEGRIELDLGAVGKGYALDRTAELLADWGIEDALIHAGTSTAVALGCAPAHTLPPEKTGWVLGAAGEWKDLAGLGTVLLNNEALSGSGKAVKGEHIIDPRTGYPALIISNYPFLKQKLPKRVTPFGSKAEETERDVRGIRKILANYRLQGE